MGGDLRSEGWFAVLGTGSRPRWRAFENRKGLLAGLGILVPCGKSCEDVRGS